jgi:hypothetical protein
MPFVTEFRMSMILKSFMDDIPKGIENWQPYNRKNIYFLNRLDKTKLAMFLKYCENPDIYKKEVYKVQEITDNLKFVFEGAKPSYHKFENCQFLHSNFVNYPIPDEIRSKGEDAVEEFRNWFKEHENIFRDYPDRYKERAEKKYNILISVNDVKTDYKNSGNKYKENLSLTNVSNRIDSLLANEEEYLHENEERKKILVKYRNATYLAFKQEAIKDNNTNFSDEELKEILIEYSLLFVEPIIYYLREFFRIYFNKDIEVNELLFEQINFKKCGHCYSTNYDNGQKFHSDRKKILIERFGEYEFSIEPTVFKYKDEGSISKAYVYTKIFKQLSELIYKDEFGQYAYFKTEIINQKNQIIYKKTKVYESEIDQIILFGSYLTEIIKNKDKKEVVLTSFGISI